MVIGNLPDGWEWSTLNDVADINYRDPQLRNLPDDLPVNFVPMAAVDAQLGTIATPEVRPLKEVRKGFTPFSDGDVIMAKITPSMENGKAAIARNLLNGRAFGSTEFHVFKPKESVLAEFLFYFIRQESFRKDAKAHFAGTAGQLRVPASFLTDYPFPLPPLPEQERIVSRIEELFSDLEAGVAALERVRAGLRRYKASVLKAAVSGDLTPHPPFPAGKGGAGGIGQLPEGWRWVKVGDVTLKMQYGTSEKADLDESGIPVLRMGNIQDGDIDYGNLKYLPENTKGIDDLVLEPGDLLFNRTNSAELVGKTAVYKENHPKATFASYLIRVKLNPNVVSDFVSYYINSLFGRNYIKSVVSQQVGQANVNGTKLSNMPTPLPPLEEQRRIVAEVERRLSVVGEVESAVEAGLVRAGRLRQAVLRSAFEGRL